MPNRKEIKDIELAFENKYDVSDRDEYDSRVDEHNPYYNN